MKFYFYSLLICSLFFHSCTYYLGPNKWAKRFHKEEVLLLKNNVALSPTQIDNNIQLFQNEILALANNPHIKYDEKYEDTVLVPRVIFAKLLMGKDVYQVNADILKFKAWGTTGTSGLVNPHGDYDFNQILFANILWYFDNQPKVLLPQTAAHIVNHLIIDNGSEPELKAPNTLGILRETENHILMKEMSRYLKNQWLFTHGYPEDKYNNKKNGMEDFFIHHLTEMLQTGFYEFNANPYISLTFEALHVFYNHASSSELQSLCKQIMDAENLQYALGSYYLKKYGPFRRRLSRASITALDGDRHNVLIKIELSKFHQEYKKAYQLGCCFDRTLISITSKYVLPANTVDIIENKTNNYYAKIGHGMKASPEIYYGTKDYLLSAGGLRFGKTSQIVPRPITLFFNDNAKTIDDCIHIKGKGKLNQWNNTGVYKNLAVANNEVTVPHSFTLIETYHNWKIYQPYSDKDLYVAICSSPNFGVIYVADKMDYKDILSQNLDENRLRNTFVLNKNESVEYNVNASKKWVFKSINNTPTIRRFGKWKRMEINYY